MISVFLDCLTNACISGVRRDFDRIDTNRIRLLFLKVSKLYSIVSKVRETGKKKNMYSWTLTCDGSTKLVAGGSVIAESTTFGFFFFFIKLQ